MVIDPRSSEQRPAALQRIFDTEAHAFLLAGSRVSGSSGVSDNKKWYFKGENTPEVINFLKENNFQIGMTPYYMSPIPMTAQVTNPFNTPNPPPVSLNLNQPPIHTFLQPNANQLSMGAWIQSDGQEFAGVMVNRALYHDQDVIIVIDLIDNLKEYTEGLIAILADREKYNAKTFSSQEKIDIAVNIATSVLARLKRAPDTVTSAPGTVKCGTEANWW